MQIGKDFKNSPLHRKYDTTLQVKRSEPLPGDPNSITAAKRQGPPAHLLPEGVMGIAASELCRYVIRPTLIYLGRHHPGAELFLLGVAASQSALGAELDSQRGHGLYGISDSLHYQLWDGYLAKDPDLASLVRGLASQHAFLTGPDLELTVNLRYSTAIAWMMVEASRTSLPAEDDVMGMARMWRRIFQPQGRLQDFTTAWQTSVRPLFQAEPAIL
jgi:hypothetical protein